MLQTFLLIRFVKQSSLQSHTDPFASRVNCTTSFTETKHTARLIMEAYRVSQHVPVHPCLTHSLVAACHLPEKGQIQCSLLFFYLPSLFSLIRVSVGDTGRKPVTKSEIEQNCQEEGIRNPSSVCQNLWEKTPNRQDV